MNEEMKWRRKIRGKNKNEMKRNFVRSVGYLTEHNEVGGLLEVLIIIGSLVLRFGSV
jgi:hypothetical protein